MPNDKLQKTPPIPTLGGAPATEIIPKKPATSDDELATLKAEVARLSAALDAKTAEVNAGQFFIPNDQEEQATGETVTMMVCTNAGRMKDSRGREVDPIYEEQEVPTYRYRINQPDFGGWDIKLDGVPYYQGEIYTVDLHTLRTLKAIIGNMWQHEASIHGNNENAYRRPVHKHLQGSDRRSA